MGHIMSLQEIFDRAVGGVLAQGGPSMGPRVGGEIGCQYRGEGGRKCAAGHLIADDFYKPDIEEWPATNSYVAATLRASGVPGETIDFVRGLQYAHDVEAEDFLRGLKDEVGFLRAFRSRARAIATRFKLSPAVTEMGADQ